VESRSRDCQFCQVNLRGQGANLTRVFGETSGAVYESVARWNDMTVIFKPGGAPHVHR
jgi:hypothetical protein